MRKLSECPPSLPVAPCSQQLTESHSDVGLSSGPSWSPVVLNVSTLPVCMEGLGLASTVLGPGVVLLTGGSCRGGRGAVSRILTRGPGGWRAVTVEPTADFDFLFVRCLNSGSLESGIRLYHTAAPLPGGASVLFGGRSSPLKPAKGLFKVTLDLCGSSASLQTGNQGTVECCVEETVCTGPLPVPRWRHTATVVRHKGKDVLFVFGGRNETEAVLGDGHFLCLDRQHWTEIPVEGAPPAPRLSHTACPYQGGAVVFGGLNAAGRPLGDVFVLRPVDRGFCWDRVEVQPPPVPRYSHSAHVIEDKLVVVGGVWLHSDGVPGVAVIDLRTGSGVEFRLDTSSVPWPLMLHSFCSELMDPAEPDLLLIGGGGNCFSFGTHLNPQPVTVDLRPVLG